MSFEPFPIGSDGEMIEEKSVEIDLDEAQRNREALKEIIERATKNNQKCIDIIF